MTRQEITERCKKIVEEHDVRTQTQFAKIYNEIYGTKICQATVHRMFAKANIIFSQEDEHYIYQPKSSSADDTADELFDFLSLHSYGKYTHEKGVPSIWLSVDFDTENLIAKAIYDYCNQNISIICGYGCLWLKCHDKDTYDNLKAILSKYCKR